MSPRSRTELALSSRLYGKLLADLRRIVETGKRRADEAVGRELVTTYHAMGKRILAAKLTERAGYGQSVLKRLAEELGLQERVLAQAISFARLYPKLPAPSRRLRWSHYRELLQLKDPQARGFYEEQAKKQKWTREKLVQAIRNQSHQRQLPKSLIEAPAEQATPQLSRPGWAHHVYKAQVEQVIDGETLMVMVELGFHLYKRQRVKLAQIDAPALNEKGGRKARDFVQATLAEAEFVMLKTERLDHSGRYTAHVFFEPQSRHEGKIFAEGQHLNQLLVDRGLARGL